MRGGPGAWAFGAIKASEGCEESLAKRLGPVFVKLGS